MLLTRNPVTARASPDICRSATELSAARSDDSLQNEYTKQTPSNCRAIGATAGAQTVEQLWGYFETVYS